MEKKCKCGRFINRPLTVDGVHIRNNKVLLIKRRNEPLKGQWALPGGYVNFDESVKEALTREMKEETGLIVYNPKLVGVFSDTERDPRQVITVAFLFSAEGELHVGDDAESFSFFPLDDLPETVAFDHKKIIQEAVKIITSS